MNALNKTDFKVKSGAAWKHYDTARLQISVGQAYHEGAALTSTLNWVNENFRSTIICVNDTLQKYNMEFDGFDSDLAKSYVEKAGEEWIKRNSKVLNTLSDVKIYRWSKWLNHPDFGKKMDFINALYQSSQAFRNITEKEIKSFWLRKQKRENLSESRFHEFYKYSLAYLKEECAAFLLMFDEAEAADIYPGSSLLPCTVFRNNDGFGVKGFTRVQVSNQT